jgi:DNA replication and repair protein RecF
VIEGCFVKNEAEDNVFCGYKRGNRKQFKKNKKDYEKLADHIGLFPVSVISPTDSELLLGGSELRRKFLDATISQYNKQYLSKLQTYNSFLIQRNSLLKTLSDKGRIDPLMLEIYDEQMQEPALFIYQERKKFLAEFTPVFNKYYQSIAGVDEDVSLGYLSHLNEENDWKSLMKSGFQGDKSRLFTTKGVHKDDLELNLKDFPVKRFGSQGQQKSFLLSLKLAQFTLLKDKTNETPILLLDDIFDKIDQSRVVNLLEIVSKPPFGQVFITDTGKSRIEEILVRNNHTYQLLFPEELKEEQTVVETVLYEN